VILSNATNNAKFEIKKRNSEFVLKLFFAKMFSFVVAVITDMKSLRTLRKKHLALRLVR